MHPSNTFDISERKKDSSFAENVLFGISKLGISSLSRSLITFSIQLITVLGAPSDSLLCRLEHRQFFIVYVNSIRGKCKRFKSNGQ